MCRITQALPLQLRGASVQPEHWHPLQLQHCRHNELRLQLVPPHHLQHLHPCSCVRGGDCNSTALHKVDAFCSQHPANLGSNLLSVQSCVAKHSSFPSSVSLCAPSTNRQWELGGPAVVVCMSCMVADHHHMNIAVWTACNRRPCESH